MTHHFNLHLSFAPKIKFEFVQAKSILSGGKVSQLLDPSLGDGYDRDQMERMVLVATLCLDMPHGLDLKRLW